MSHLLTYRDSLGHSHVIERDSLTDLIQAIRDLNDEGGAVSVLSIEEDQDAPLTWTRPEAPEGVTRVLGEATGQTWTAVKNRIGLRPLWSNGSYSLPWPELLTYEKTLTAVVETELEGAARRLRENGEGWDKDTIPEQSVQRDMRTVLAHVLNGGTL